MPHNKALQPTPASQARLSLSCREEFDVKLLDERPVLR
jgi:hypothetical protein